jgi:hypothetical protein
MVHRLSSLFEESSTIEVHEFLPAATHPADKDGKGKQQNSLPKLAEFQLLQFATLGDTADPDTYDSGNDIEVKASGMHAFV